MSSNYQLLSWVAPMGWVGLCAPSSEPEPLLPPSLGHFRRPPHWPGPAQLLRAEAKAALLPARVSPPCTPAPQPLSRAPVFP